MHICWYARAPEEQKLIHLSADRAASTRPDESIVKGKRKLVGVVCRASKLLTHGFFFAFFEWNQLCNGASTVAPSACIVYQSI
jgi:hypothetical protein